MAQASVQVKSLQIGKTYQNLVKLPLVALVIAAMIAGVWSALIRIGWALPAPITGMAGLHGPLMIGGVLGTLIGLERAVALAAFSTHRLHWSYIAPAASGFGALLLLTGATGAAQLLILLGSAGLLAGYGRLLGIHVTAYTLVMGTGALAWLVGNLLWWAGQPLYLATHWWIAFLVLTVVGERLELARMTRMTPGRRNLFLAAVLIYLLGLSTLLIQLDAGVRVAGLGQLLLALWLARYDIARRTILKTGLTRYMAACLLGGYVWLGIAGLLGIGYGAVYAGYAYDALIHAVLLGFIFAMIFGHAPIILPALTGLNVQFRPLFYAPLVALHATLLLRQIGNWMAWADVRMWGGLLNAVSIILFFIIILSSVRRSHAPDSQTG